MIKKEPEFHYDFYDEKSLTERGKEKMKKIRIQDEVYVSQDWVDNLIDVYNNMNEKFSLCMGDFVGNGKKIAEEIKKTSNFGKQIMMMNYRFEQSDFYKQNKDKFVKLNKRKEMKGGQKQNGKRNIKNKYKKGEQ